MHTARSILTLATTSDLVSCNPTAEMSIVMLQSAAVLTSTVRHSAWPVPMRLMLLFAARLSVACADVLSLSGPRKPLLEAVVGTAWRPAGASVLARAPVVCVFLGNESLRAIDVQPDVPGSVGAEPWQ